MTNVAIVIKTCAVTLFLIEIASVIIRSHTYHKKREPRLFLVIIGLICLKIIFPELPYFREFSVFLLLFSLKQYLAAIIPYRREKIYNFSFYGIVCISIVAIPMGVFHSLTYTLFFSFASAYMAFPVFLLMFRLFQKVGKKSLLVIMAVALAAFVAGGVEQFVGLWPRTSFSISDVFLLALGLGLGYLIFEEEYFLVSSLQVLSARLSEEEKRSHDVARRLLSTEESLIAQDRLISIGTLAGGLTHEFKNILSLISSCAQFGLMNETMEKKNQSLTLIQEHVEHSMGSVIRVLEQIKSHKKIDPQEVDVCEFLNRFSKIVRANYRTSGIDISLDVRQGFIAVMKRDDLEQILLNLIRNAVNALQGNAALARRAIALVAFRESGQGIVEVRDNAGGVSEEQALRLFEFHDDSRSSTGLGLYLTRLLAEQNGLALRYSLNNGESCFGILFPAEIMSDATPAPPAARPVF
jgi:signal transduction histidine kinase